ncbi:MAG: transcription antitermination factor NusB [bacterium]
MVSPQPSARQISVGILEDVFNNGLFADELVARVFQQIPLNKLDRSLIMELVNGTLRWRGQLDWILAKYFRGNFNNSPIKLRSILELTLYQIKFLDKVPNYAAVSEGVELAKNEGGTAWGNLVNGVL